MKIAQFFPLKIKDKENFLWENFAELLQQEKFY